MGESPDLCCTQRFRKLQGKLFINWIGGSVQGLTRHQLTPFVTKQIASPKGYFDKDPKHAFSGERYLAKWKAENGED